MKRKDIPSPVEKVQKINLSENSSKAVELLKAVKLRDEEKSKRPIRIDHRTIVIVTPKKYDLLTKSIPGAKSTQI
ncbi:MAG: hypothetical protein H6Q12_57 [Bacteroidetes bacterium]|nr:hypothetical protein [Bacteroidota bacterium]